MPDSTQTRAGELRPDVLAACALAAVPGLGPAALDAIAGHFKSLDDALTAGPRAIAANCISMSPATAAYLARNPDLRALGRWAIDAARSAGAHAVVRKDAAYPKLLAGIEHPPAVLYVRGELPCLARRVAVVGARAADGWGQGIADRLGAALARVGVEVVSGGARGIDTAAHEGALRSGRTVAVLGTGIDVPYPRSNARLFDRIAAGGGAVVSEFPPGTGGAKQNFPQRNRTLSGLSEAAVVVRAAADSGALITAKHARAQGRPVFAFAGEEGVPLAEGPRRLIADGSAVAVSGVEDLLERLGCGAPPASGHAAARVQHALGEADEMTRRVWRGLDAHTPAHVDDLALRARIPARLVLRALGELELKGMCLQRPGKFFLRR